jgi:hypothetical protein
LSNSAETPSETTAASYGPVLGVIERKYWLSVSGSQANWTLGKQFGQRPMRNIPNHICSSGVGVIVASTVLRPALPRRGWSIV